MQYIFNDYVYYACIAEYTDSNYSIMDIIDELTSIQPEMYWAMSPYINSNAINVFVAFRSNLLIESDALNILIGVFNKCKTKHFNSFIVQEEFSLDSTIMDVISQMRYSTFKNMQIFYQYYNLKGERFENSTNNTKFNYLGATKREILKEAKNISSDILEEAKRIYQCNDGKYSKNPFNYIIECVDNWVDTCKLITNILKINHRILKGSLYYASEYGPNIHTLIDIMNQNIIISFYSICFYNDQENSSAYRRISLEFDDILNKMRKNDTVTFFITHSPLETKKIIDHAIDSGYYNLVVLRDEKISYKKSITIAKQYAKEIGIPSEKYEDLINYVFPFKDYKEKMYRRPNIKRMVEDYYECRYKMASIFSVYEKAILNNDLKNITPESHDELDCLIGLDNIKIQVDKIIKTFKFYRKMANEGLFDSNISSRHMVFTGNPGTAKTTVAYSLYQKLLMENIIGGKFVTCGRADLIGKYVGWTAIQVREKFQEAIGGVLFIDEAYSLVEGGDNDFGKEAISTIIQEMEDNRGNVIVIFAGYPREMKAFIDSNPGLKSRINFYIDFPDYDIDELVDIMVYLARVQRLEFSDKAIEVSKEFIKRYMNKPNFGNGRWVRNYIDKILMNHASRLMDTGKDPSVKEVITITPEDCKNISMDDIKIKEIKTGF